MESLIEYVEELNGSNSSIVSIEFRFEHFIKDSQKLIRSRNSEVYPSDWTDPFFGLAFWWEL